MELVSARALKLQVARDVFAPIVDELLGRAMALPRVGPLNLLAPLQRIALGIAPGSGDGDFHLAVRLQSRSRTTQRFVERVRDLVKDELHISFVGRVTPFDDPPTIAQLRQTCRPLTLGCSVAHIAATAGTLGLLAVHRKTGRNVAVSCSHVLAQAGQAKLGDAIIQPGRTDGGSEHVAALLDFVPLKTSGSNQVDVAIAALDDTIAIAPEAVPGIGTFTFADAEAIRPGMKVSKLGRTTGLTVGTITAVELDDLVVDYDIGTVVFDDQIEITGGAAAPFSRPGDSGSLVVGDAAVAIGMIFSGNPNANDGAGVSYAHPLPKVLSGLSLDKLS